MKACVAMFGEMASFEFTETHIIQSKVGIFSNSTVKHYFLHFLAVIVVRVVIDMVFIFLHPANPDLSYQM